MMLCGREAGLSSLADTGRLDPARETGIGIRIHLKQLERCFQKREKNIFS